MLNNFIRFNKYYIYSKIYYFFSYINALKKIVIDGTKYHTSAHVHLYHITHVL